MLLEGGFRLISTFREKNFFSFPTLFTSSVFDQVSFDCVRMKRCHSPRKSLSEKQYDSDDSDEEKQPKRRRMSTRRKTFSPQNCAGSEAIKTGELIKIHRVTYDTDTFKDIRITSGIYKFQCDFLVNTRVNNRKTCKSYVLFYCSSLDSKMGNVHQFCFSQIRKHSKG